MTKENQQPKLDMTALPLEALLEIYPAAKQGIEKYGRRGWELLTDEQHEQLLGSAQTHLCRHAGGEEKDADSGQGHLSHAALNLLIYLARERKKREGVDEDGVPF